MNSSIFLGILSFLVWASFSTWYYTCKIKNLCIEEQVSELVETKEEPIIIKDSLITIAPDLVSITIEENGLLFAKNSVRPISTDRLDGLVKRISDELKDRSFIIEITGHTCNLGTDSYNLKLGLKRADFVKKFLIDSGIDDNIIEVKSAGENSPLFPNNSEENKSKNRRTEITINTSDI